MYWYKPLRKYILVTGGLLLLGFGFACKPEIKETGAALKYFDLKEFFKADSARLARLNPTITKTVSHNGDSQTKKLKITNWGQEFNLFTSSDINKPAWKDSYSVQENTDSLVYQAKFPELKTRRIVIRKSNGKVASVYILNNIHNIIYTTTETLNYTPGQSYLIEKQQKVKVMGENDYLIKGVFN
jgi:hypothetical protein